MSRGLVAHHFGTKDVLWRECVSWLMGTFHDELVSQHRALADVSPHERACALLKVYVRFAARHPEYTRLLVLSGTDDSERVRWMIDEWMRPDLAFFRDATGLPALDTAKRISATATYAFIGAASIIFTLPIELKELFGIDTTNTEFIEEYADLMGDLGRL